MANEVSPGVVTVQPSRWWVVVLLGLVSIAAGVLAISYPDITLRVLGLFVGVALMLIGITWIVVAAEENAGVGMTTLQILVGIIATIAGLICLVRPGASVLAVLVAVAFWFLLAGIADIARALTVPEGRWFAAVIGALSIAVGVILLADPDIGLSTIAIITGLGFIVRGVVEVTVGIWVKVAT